MPNTQTSVPAFTAGQVLTAAQMTDVNTGIPVFATTTTRDAAFGGTGEKTLAEGQFAYIEASNTTQYYDGAAWQTIGGGLTLIKTQTIGTAVSSVTVSDVFSATYDNYLITIDGGVGSTDMSFRFTLGSTSANYRFTSLYVAWNSGTISAAGGNTSAYWDQTGQGSTNALNGRISLFDPFLAKNTIGHWQSVRANTSGENVIGWGVLSDTTSYTAFTLTTISGNMTGGTIRVYGQQNS